MPTQLDICLCTYNPRREVLEKVIASVRAQDCDHSVFRFVLLDNASTPPVAEKMLAPLREAGIAADLIVENRQGIFHARNRAMRETSSGLVLWIDDDTELPPGYISQCLRISAANPDIGCFGGRLFVGASCRYPRWCDPFLPYLAIIDRGPEVITGMADHWGPWEPPTAGAVVRRQVIAGYLDFIATLPSSMVIGQVGSKELLRGEDSLLMRMASRVGLKCSYQPSLHAWHHVDNRRFRLPYLLRLFHGYGRSYVILERMLQKEIPPLSRKGAWNFLWSTKTRGECSNWPMFLAMKAWNLGFIAESNNPASRR